MFQQIVVTLDGSEYSERALPYVQRLARLTGARVRVVSVALPSDPPSVPPAGTPSEDRRQRWLSYLQSHVDFLRGDGIEVTADVRSGDEPAAVITQFAREVGADLIVLSTEGLGKQSLGAEDPFGLGSVAASVLATASCPVFVVRINRPEPPRTLAEERWQDEGGANVG